MKVNSLALALLAASSKLNFSMAQAETHAETETTDGAGAGPPFSPQIFYVLAGIKALTPVIKEHETPIAGRFASYYDAANWNCVAAFSESYKDSLTRLRPSIVSSDPATHTTKDRAACLVQATASLNDLFFGGLDAYLTEMKQFEELDIEGTVPTDMKDCLALMSSSHNNLRSGSVAAGKSGKERHLSSVDTCLEKIARTTSYNPTTMGHTIAVQTYSYATVDGFNMLGTDDGCTSSCRPYSDTSGYEPVNARGRWQPLIDDNGKGFFYEQKFVTPHIGTKAKFRFLPESDREERIVRGPIYSKTRLSEMEAVIAQMTLLDDYKKIEIEAFDDKLYTTTQIIGAFVNKLLQDGYVDSELGQDGYILSLERLLHFVQGITAVELDSIIIAWKEKAKYDLVRPTSVVKELGDQEITTWSLNKGITTFKARDFEAYKRVMVSVLCFDLLRLYKMEILVLSSSPSIFPT